MLALESIFPMYCQWDQAVDDVANVPVDAVSIRLVSGAKNLKTLPSYTKLKSLWCFDVGADALDAICSCASIESLYIENIKTVDLRALKRLTHLTVLGLERCSKLTSIADLGELESLAGLGITHFKNVHDLGPLARLKELRALAVAGSIWTTMRVKSFQPLAELRALEYLHLTNIKPDDGSLKPLAQLTSLKKLELANFYKTSEFAWLARRLQSTECQWFRPYVEVSVLPCKKCGAASMAMLTGKGTTMACVACDRPKLEKQIREWTIASAAIT
jgi:hypothetical protein